MSGSSSEASGIGTQASREGHEYHVAWAANVCIGLLHPNSPLAAISMEGFSTEEPVKLGEAAAEIADLVQYYGGGTIPTAERIEVIQLKFSPSNPNANLTAANLKKTLEKFVKTQEDIVKILGYQKTIETVSFQFVSNRPIGESLNKALTALKENTKTKGHAETQRKTLSAAISLNGERLTSFLDRLSIVGEDTTRSNLSSLLHRTLSRLGGASDATARLRFLELQDLLRQTAGIKGALNNTITQIDVLGALGIDQLEELFPTPESFPDVSVVLERDFIPTICQEALSSNRPYIVHGPGGIGKTVVMQSLGKRLGNGNQVILFDGFGGGSWRAPNDARHLASFSLLHIVNTLAIRNLCDLILPDTDDDKVLRTAIRRLKQASQMLQEEGTNQHVILLLDAIDHAGERAISENRSSFAERLLHQLDLEPIKGVHVIASCRTERRDKAYGSRDYPDFEIPAFTSEEARQLARRRRPNITPAEESILISNSGGNPRCIDMLLEDDELFDNPIDSGTKDLLETLLEKRFNRAIEHAKTKGSFDTGGETLIASLRMLPPPVPINELTEIFGIPKQAIQSFVSDLYPLIESIPGGLKFRDEPTENLAQKYVTKNFAETDRFIKGLRDRQTISAYCARALPSLLIEFDRPTDLLDLAFSDDYPISTSSTVARRNIKLARISAAIRSCIKGKRYDDIFSLMIEAAIIANGTQRSDRYLQDFPDLAVASGDHEALRRIFEGKATWSGARFSSHALAYAFSDLHEEASRSCDIAIKWLNWRIGQTDEDKAHPHERPQSENWYGAIYVLLLSGDLDRILSWLANSSRTSAFNFISHLFGFLALHAKDSDTARKCLQSTIQQACQGDISHDFFLVALALRCEMSKSQEKIIIRHLSILAVDPQESDERFWTETEEASLKEALLFVVMRAIKNGQRSEARRILSKVSCSRPGTYEYGTNYVYERKISIWLMFSALNAILNNRKPNIGDFLPREIWTKLPKSTRSRGPKAINDAVSSLLNGKKNRKPNLSHQELEEIKRALETRCRPLVAYAEWARDLLLKPQEDHDLSGFLRSLDHKVKAASNYPYHDQKSYLGRTGAISLFNTITQADMWTKKGASAFADWIADSSLRSPSLLISFVSGLSSRKESHLAALKLSKFTCIEIKKETDTAVKIDSLANLARSIWRVSKAEAGDVFKQGLDLADKLGSDDHYEIEALIHCAQAYNGPPLPDEVLHNFNRICELNFPHEAEKFIWSGYGNALAKIGGTKTLPLVSRLADRGTVDLDYSLPPLLASLTKYKKISPELSAPLIGLDAVTETWTWDLSDFFESAFPGLTTQRKALLAEWVAKEYDRSYTNSPPTKPLSKLAFLLEKNKIEIPNYQQITAPSQEPDSANKEALKNTIEMFRDSHEARPLDFDATDFDALRKDIAEEISLGSSVYTVWRRLARVIYQTSELDDVLALIANISMLEDAPLQDVLHAYETIKNEWGEFSSAISRAIEKGTAEAVSRKPSDFFVDNWELSKLLRDVCAFIPGRQSETICQVLKSLGNQLAEFDSSQWIRFASFMAYSVSDEAIKKGLMRYVELKSGDVPEDFGDGAWSSDYAPQATDEKIVSTLIWNQLGSPYTALRWRAAHAVVRFAQFNRVDILENLIENFNAAKALPFHHPTFPFYADHARLWLLIALTKIARETPRALTPFTENLVDIAVACGDHCLQKHYSVQILEHLRDKDKKFSYGDALEELKRQITPIGVVSKDHMTYHRADSYQGRTKGSAILKTEFHFDYDFKKYEIDGLGRLFGIDTWKVADDMSDIIAGWETDISRTHSCPRDSSSDERRYKEQHPYGYYLGFHALLIAAGRYLKSHPIVQVWSDDSWEEWLQEYSLTGPWLADFVDYFPVSMPSCEINLESPPPEINSKERESLAAVITQGKPVVATSEILISGRWKNKEGVSFRISSAFVDRKASRAIAYALMIQNPFFNHLPVNDEECHDPWSNRGLSNPLSAIVDHDDFERSRMDEYDPYGIMGADGGPHPSDSVIKELNLSFSDEHGKQWLSPDSKTVFSKKIWGANFGRGRHRYSKSGDYLACSLKGLQGILQSRKKDMILLVRAVKYHEHQKIDDKYANKSSIVLISPNGKLQTVMRMPRAVRAAANKLSTYSKADFIDCYLAVMKATSEAT